MGKTHFACLGRWEDKRQKEIHEGTQRCLCWEQQGGNKAVLPVNSLERNFPERGV